jgi:methyl-accepting chemotaxis protein
MKNRSLNFKIGLIVVVLQLGICLVGTIGILRMSSINQSLVNIVENDVKHMSTAMQTKTNFYQLMLSQRDVLLADDVAKMKEIQAQMLLHEKSLEEKITTLENLSDPEEKLKVAEFKETFASWWKLSVEVQSLALAQKREEALTAQKTSINIRMAALGMLQQFVEKTEKDMSSEQVEAGQSYVSARNWSVGTILFMMVLGQLTSFFIRSKLTKSITSIITNLRSGSEQVSQAARQIASSSEQLSETSTEQASSLEETVATIEEMTSMVTGNAQNAKQASQLSKHTSDTALKGEVEIRALVVSMSEISQQSKKISEITNVIDDIAFQTNLLALNAAVEAARAGEQGKGFAVVAEAVRALAQRSSVAAKDISGLISESVLNIEKGSLQADAGGKVLNEIVDSVKKVTHLNGEIATASSEQANGIAQIGKAMNQLDQVTQANAATSEEAAASAEELSSQAAMLKQVVDDLVVTILGHSGKSEEAKSTSVSNEPAVMSQARATHHRKAS